MLISGIHYILFKDVIKIDNDVLEHNCPVQKSSAVQQNLIMILRATKTYTNGFKELFTSTSQMSRLYNAEFDGIFRVNC